MHEFHDIGSLEDVLWTLNTDQDYQDACSRCEIHVVLDERAHRVVLATLAIVPAKGTVLTADIPFLDLLKWDRLEPSMGLLDVQCLCDASRFPFPCVFWRLSLETNTRHRNPLLMAIGVSPTDSLTVDTLHTHTLLGQHAGVL